MSAAVHTSAPVPATAVILSARMAADTAGVLDRERSAETATGVGHRQLLEGEAVYLTQQLQRLVADPQHPQRMAGGVVGHPMRITRADIADTQNVDQ